MAPRLTSSLLASVRPGALPTVFLPSSSSASSSSGSASTSRRHAHSYVLTVDPKRDVYVDGQLSKPLSSTAHLPTLPFTPLFPLYVSLTPFSPMPSAQPPPEASVLPLPRDIFGLPLRRDILQACVVHHLNLLKRSTVHVLHRGEVRGSGRKLHPQKGMGRARQGDSGSGHRNRDGARVTAGKRFGARKDRVWTTELNRKVRQLGFRTALSQKLREGRLWVVPEGGFNLEDWTVVRPKDAWLNQASYAAAKTGAVKQRLEELGFSKTLLLHSPWSPPPADLLPRGIANLPDVQLLSISSVTTYDLLKAADVVLDVSAVEWLVGKIRGESRLEHDHQFDGNAMVMRRRKLGLSDFPAEGEQDESKAMLEALEARLRVEAEKDGRGGYWKIPLAERERLAADAAVKLVAEANALAVGDAKPVDEAEWEDVSAEEASAFEEEAEQLVGGLKDTGSSSSSSSIAGARGGAQAARGKEGSSSTSI